jgi:MFS family permease
MKVDSKKTQNSLTREQKQAVGLLSVGTFLEYFDLMLYVHMAVLLNELFFPKTDPFTASLFSAFAFCSTYLLRPFGALIFGYIGDNIGRKHTVIITTFIMSISCVVMANLPTYAQIGISATWIVTICRVLQGMCAMGEGTGAEIYLTEMVKPPMRYPSVAFVVIFATLGTTAALAAASFIISYDLSWRVVFWIGAIVAFIGTLARTTLRETPDFADARKRIKKVIKNSNRNIETLETSDIWKEKVNKKTALALFLIQCMWPAAMYFAYIHCGNVGKNLLSLTSEQIINQNFIVSSVQLASYILLTCLCYKIYPLFILKIKLFIFSCFILFVPFLLTNISSSFEIMLIQIFVVIFVPTDFPGVSIFYIYFPVVKRFTCSCLMYALSRAIMSVVTSFGLVYLIHHFNNLGVLFIMIPLILGYKFGLSHFENLEKEAGNYPLSKKKSLIVYN